jgi:hypothetical protein
MTAVLNNSVVAIVLRSKTTKAQTLARTRTSRSLIGFMIYYHHDR